MSTSSVPPLKRCTKCGEEKPATVEYFHRFQRMKDGLATLCKPCAIKRTQDRYQLKRDEIRAGRKLRYDERRDEINAKKRQDYQRDSSRRLEENKRYRVANPEKIAASKKQYRQRNREELKLKRKQRYAQDRSTAIADSRAYYRENKSVIRQRRHAYNRQYNLAHREEKRLWALEYYKRNPEKAKAATHRRLARKRGLPATLTSNQWQACLEYFCHKCAACERSVGFWHTLAADHWIPLSDPYCPGTTVDNTVPLCHGDGGCNNSKGAKLAEIWLVERFGKLKAKQILDRINTYFKWVKQKD